MLPANLDHFALEPSRGRSLVSKARLLVKFLMYPGTNWVSRDKSKVVKMFSSGTVDEPIQTLDCGCGNAYFGYHAVRKNSRCVGITIHEWERRNCVEMRDFLGMSDEQLQFRLTTLEQFAANQAEHAKYDQVLMLDVIEHILDARKALEQVHALTAEDGLVYITTPDRDWEGNANRIRVSRHEDGWHVRNGYSFDQLEAILDEAGFEPVDRLKFGTAGSTLVTWIQHRIYGPLIDPLTVITFPMLKILSLVLSPWRDPHTIFVLARKKRTAKASGLAVN